MNHLPIYRLGIVSLIFLSVASSQPPSIPNIPIRISAGYNQSEPWCSIDPANPKNIVAVWHDKGLDTAHPANESGAVSISTDRGLTWNNHSFLPTADQTKTFMADPSVYVDRSGNILTCSIMANAQIPSSAWGIGVIKRNFTNSDAGITMVTGNTGYDRPQMSVDIHPGSNTLGRVYVSYYQSTGPGQKYGLKYATNGGSSFSNEIWTRSNSPASQPPETQACLSSVSIPAAGKNGMIAVAYNDNIDGAIAITVGTLVSGAYQFELGTPIPITLGCLSTVGGMIAATYPMMVIDNGNYIHLTYADFNSGDWIVYYKRSTNNGITWDGYSLPVGNFTGGYTFQPTITVNDDDVVSISFYHVSNGDDADYYVIKSYDQGLTFTDPIKISGVSSDASQNGSRGDYQGFSSHAEYDVAIWSDFRNGNSDIYGALVLPSEITYNPTSGWNLISIPLVVGGNPPDYTYVWPELPLSNEPYGWNGSALFAEVNPMIGVGYWGKFSDPTIHHYVGTRIISLDISVISGWNLIGSISQSLAISQIGRTPPTMVLSKFWTMDNGAYQAATVLTPGKAYWVKSDVAGVLTLDPTSTANYPPSSSPELPPDPPVFTPPDAPILLLPENGATLQPTNPTLVWTPSVGASSYHLQISTSSNFASIFQEHPFITTTSKSVVGLANTATYYWRVAGTNVNGDGEWSTDFHLSTVNANSPPATTLSGTTSQGHPSLSWLSVGSGITYKVYRYTCQGLSDCNLTGTVKYSGPNLSWVDNYAIVGQKTDNAAYWYYVTGTNSAGTSPKSNKKSFYMETEEEERAHVGIVPGEEASQGQYFLSENYPNPFNPATTISYTLPEDSYVVLKIYTPLGELVQTLVDGFEGAGDRSVLFDAKDLPAGVYFYQIRAGNINQVRKMLFIK